MKNLRMLPFERAYDRAFDRCWRQAKEIDLGLPKLLEPEPSDAPVRSQGYYIWYTQDDEKVRPSHKANHGKIFAWSDPPVTGHPGDEFGCRCWAEPLKGEMYARQTLLTSISSSAIRWSDLDFTNPYRSGNGVGVTLRGTGWLGDIIKHYGETLGVYDRVNQQIVDAAIAAGPGVLTYDFYNTYKFGSILFILGESTVSGVFDGMPRREKQYLVIDGTISYEFTDEYKDPLSFVENLEQIPGFSREEAEEMVGDAGDFAGTVYPITDSWQTKFTATVTYK